MSRHKVFQTLKHHPEKFLPFPVIRFFHRQTSRGRSSGKSLPRAFLWSQPYDKRASSSLAVRKNQVALQMPLARRCEGRGSRAASSSMCLCMGQQCLRGWPGLGKRLVWASSTGTIWPNNSGLTELKPWIISKHKNWPVLSLSWNSVGFPNKEKKKKVK